MGKIGRNAHCPCGSGKKFKKCCLEKMKELDKPKAIKPSSQEIMASTWDIESVRSLETEQIIEKLRDIGVDFSKEKFFDEVKNFYSVGELVENWENTYSIADEDFEDDFIWRAAEVLWERLAPHVINSEQMDEKIQEGYKLLEKNNFVEACILWLTVWEQLKERFSPGMKSIDEADRIFKGMEPLFNWCQDLEEELGNAGREEISFNEKRLKYCREFCCFFPQSDRLVIENMKRAEAESYFALGRIEEGEAAFKALIEEFPESPWGYIGWADMYWLWRNEEVPLDFEKAEKIYREALSKNFVEKEEITDRLRGLEIERKKANFPKNTENS